MDIMFVAEVSSNHHQDLDRCLNFIDVSAEIGCDAVKFQLFKLNKLFSADIISQNKDIQKRARWELPLEFLPSISKRCREKNIKFMCTPFYLEAVMELLPFVDSFKISSYDLLRDDLLSACIQTKKPIIVSTGMATLEEISHAVSVLKDNLCENFSLLHCVSAYPTLPNDCNLASIATMRNKFACPIGWSDHTVSPAVIFRAIFKWNAEIIEFHLDIDGQGEEYGFGHCWLPEQIKKTIDIVKTGFDADGDGQIAPLKSELCEREWRADPQDGLRPFKYKRIGYKVVE